MNLIIDSPNDLAYEDNIDHGEIELSNEAVMFFVDLFWEDLFEKCSYLFEGFDGSASGEKPVPSCPARNLQAVCERTRP